MGVKTEFEPHITGFQVGLDLKSSLSLTETGATGK